MAAILSCNNDPKLDLIGIQFQQLHSLLREAEVRVREGCPDHLPERERLIMKCENYIEEAQKTKQFAEKNIQDNDLKLSIIDDCESKIAKAKADKLEAEKLAINVVWSDLGFEVLKMKINSIKVGQEDSSKLPDLTRAVRSGGAISSFSGEGKLVLPNHLAIEEETSNIYISDWKGACVQIFDKNAVFLRIFKHKFSNPRAILIRNCKLYVIESDADKKIIRFKIFSIKDDKKLMFSAGKVGSRKGEIGIAGSFDITADEKWFISEPNNRRIQILNPNLTHHSFFSPSTEMHPIHIRIRGDVYVLDHQAPTKILIFSFKDETLLSSIRLSGGVTALYFAILAPHCFIISDLSEECLKIFDFEGKFLRSGETLTKPKGVEVLEDGRVVSVSMNEPGPCLNIY